MEKTTPSALSASESTALEWIDSLYAKIKEVNTSFVARPSQVDLSKNIFQSFLAKKSLVAEAPTGTGKTLAYLIGALAYKHVTGTAVVISTATKLLQEQVIHKDLPVLIACGAIALNKVGLAKGRSNFLCVKAAKDLIDTLNKATDDPDVYLGEDEQAFDVYMLEEILNGYASNEWDGDFDKLEGRVPPSVIPIAVNGDTCKGPKCADYSSCAYFGRKLKLAKCDLIVTNHDLLLRDLSGFDEDPAMGVLPFSDYALVIDEAHHLSDKAIKVGSSEMDLKEVHKAALKSTGMQALIKKDLKAFKLFEHKLDVPVLEATRQDMFDSLRNLSDMVGLIKPTPPETNHRFKKGVLPPALSRELNSLGMQAETLLKIANMVLSECSLCEDDAFNSSSNTKELVSRAIDIKKVFTEVKKCTDEFNSSKQIAKWLSITDTKVVFQTSPLEGADTLKRILWTSPRVKCTAMVSATLRDVKGFNRFDAKTGITPGTKHMTLPYCFDYAQSKLVVAGFKHTPKIAEKALFIKELKERLPKYIKTNEGSLLIFPSWALMKELVPVLKARLGENFVKVQGDATVKTLLKRHCQDLDNNRGSLLVGVATFSEGLDLPGKYCTHVGIVSIPFAVPTDPVEQEISDVLGSRYFGEKSLPDAAVRLVQFTGRLLRRESDRGRITVFDIRLANTSYGQNLIKLLPPYTLEVE